MDTEVAKNPLAELSGTRKIVLLLLFCLSQFLDSFNISALFLAIPAIATGTGLNNSQSVWLNSAYQLSFAALLLIVSPPPCSPHQLIVCGLEWPDERHLQPKHVDPIPCGFFN